MAALTTRTDNTATNVVSDPISTYDSRDVLFSSALSVFISPNFLFLFPFGSELLLVTKQFRKVLNKSLSFLISFLFQLLLFQKVLIGFEFFKFCDFWLFAIFKSFRFPSAMDDEIEKRNYQTILEYVMYTFYASCPYNQVDGSDLTNLEVLAIFYSSSNIK